MGVYYVIIIVYDFSERGCVLISADDFLYARCAVVAEGRNYYEKVLNDSSQMPEDIVFEPLLYLADDAFEMKTGIPFNYVPTYNYETQSNKLGWQ